MDDLLPGPVLAPVTGKELLVGPEKELGLSLRSCEEAWEWLRDAFWAGCTGSSASVSEEMRNL